MYGSIVESATYLKGKYRLPAAGEGGIRPTDIYASAATMDHHPCIVTRQIISRCSHIALTTEGSMLGLLSENAWGFDNNGRLV